MLNFFICMLKLSSFVVMFAQIFTDCLFALQQLSHLYMFLFPTPVEFGAKSANIAQCDCKDKCKTVQYTVRASSYKFPSQAFTQRSFLPPGRCFARD